MVRARFATELPTKVDGELKKNLTRVRGHVATTRAALSEKFFEYNDMNEATLQQQVVEAMHNVCGAENHKMRIGMPASRSQNAADAKGQPYDVGVLFGECYLVGLEFKHLANGRFSSWDPDQHAAYVALTTNDALNLPLFYVYNAVGVEMLADFYTERLFVPLLEQTNIAAPETLQNAEPYLDDHDDVYQWLLSLLRNSGQAAVKGWPAALAIDDALLATFKKSFPDVIWLLISAQPGLRESWALTHTELLSLVEDMRHVWRSAHLRSAQSTAALSAAFVDAVKEIARRADATADDAQNQQENDESMDDRPQHKPGGPI